MRIRVLGSAAGGGFPQWNCGCDNCRRARDPKARSSRRSEECVALSANGEDWFLLNVPAAHPVAHRLSSPISV